MEKVSLKLPAYVEAVMKTIVGSGYKAYLVGGSVRDAILKRTPRDYDICTEAPLSEVVGMFGRVVDYGREKGTVAVILEDGQVEVSSFSDRTLKDDLERRDFTINAVAAEMDGTIYDPFGGVLDIFSRTVRATVNPDRRFAEDPLRLLRAVRLAVELNFKIERDTYWSIKANRNLIKFAAPERIRKELEHILLSDKPSTGIELLSFLGLLDYIIPELVLCLGFEQYSPHHDYSVYQHLLLTLNAAPKDIVLK